MAQESKKTLVTKRVNESPKIDGILDDVVWSDAPTASDFVMYRPTPGSPISEGQRTEVKVVYDDEAIYFGVYLYDDKPEDILRQFSTRDNFGVADWFAVVLNPYNDQQNDTEFYVQVTGNRMDGKSNFDDRDFSWSAVWDSKVKTVEDGWIIEMKIPYSAIRFSNEKIQTWGINFHRFFEKSQNHYSWNFIDPTKGEMQQYSGLLRGVENLKPPTRLSFTPYASVALDADEGENSFNKSIGLDLKYGISEGFTLDATLIPDFGQTAFDNLVLNLGPFEQQYIERRPFFTEGIELFSKGNMFYSRRVGGEPINYLDEDDLEEDEEIVDNPEKATMLNAIKLSGRTKGNLGIGIFNAITIETVGKVKDTITGETRSIVTEPLANYNVLVFDQVFKENSSVTLINTNVLREGGVRNANATGLLLNLKNKNNTYFFDGSAKMSAIRAIDESSNGYFLDGSIGKDAGNVQFEAGYRMADENYDINDLGFNRYNNYQRVYADMSYRIFEPTDFFRRYRIFLFGNLTYRHSDGAYTGNRLGISFSATTLELFSFGANINGNIGEQYDYYEPRVEDRYFTENPRLGLNAWIETNEGKKLSFDSYIYYGLRIGVDQTYIEFEVNPEYRVNDKFSLDYALSLGRGKNQKGYVDELEDGTIIFGNRNTKEIVNSLSGRYSFSIKSSAGIAFRQYWSPVIYDTQYYELEEDGSLSPNPYDENNDINYNVWNLDLSYTWEFAPGSQLVALYRNNIFNEDDLAQLDFYENLTNLFGQPQRHNFSIKAIYYIDYNNAKGWFKKKA